MSASRCLSFAASAAMLLAALPARAQWNGYGGDPQHTAISTASVPAQALDSILWSTPVDDSPPTGTIYRHYGSPLVTAANTVIVPVRTADGGYRIEAHNAASGAAPLWQLPTDFNNFTANSNIPHTGGWVPSFSPTLTPSGALYYQGAGGTVYRVANPNSTTAPTAVPLHFYPGYSADPAAYNSAVYITTPITSDAVGNIYFGYETTAALPNGLTSGIARIAPNGSATYTSVDAASGLGGTPGLRVATNCAPAISSDGTKLYVAVRDDSGGSAYLMRLDTATLASPRLASLGSGVMFDGSTASPTVAPDGTVFFGTAGGGYHARGLLRHFTADLAEPFAPGSFGWDITPSIVPRNLVDPLYVGSDYYVMVKYNDYYQTGGDGLNRLAILNPNATRYEPQLGRNVMDEVLTIDGVTLDLPNPGVREWCINTAAVDLLTRSLLVNSEDGVLYRWDLPTNKFTQRIALQAEGTLEAYTPTVIGPDGTVFAINKARLFAVGVPEPASAALLAIGGLLLGGRRRR